MRRAAFGIGAAMVALGACAGSAHPVAAPSPAGTGPLARDMVVREACAPTGPERCFNARDDNCNGIIDEGCGVHTGLVQFMIAWDAKTADVDLLVTDPKGELVEVGRPSVTGLVKERDCPGPNQECRGTNVENVYLDREEAKRGVYRVRIHLERIDDDDVPIRVTLGARVGPKTYAGEALLVRSEDDREFVFEL